MTCGPNVILFGAGASRGAGQVAPEPPPLGQQLFQELAHEFRHSWGALPEELKARFRSDFEEAMDSLWQANSTVVPLLMQHMALYFLQFRPKSPGSTLYGQLARLIGEWAETRPVILSTLNYDCVLELELSNADLVVDYWGLSTSPRSVRVMKLHGSANMIPIGVRMNRGIRYTRGVSIEGPVRACDDLNDATTFLLGDNALAPVMCLYMKDKPVESRGVV